MATRLKQYLLVAVAALSFIVMPSAADAQYVQLVCNNSGGVQQGQFYYADQANQLGACQFQGVQHIFSQVVCDFVTILNSILGQAYCGIQYAITPILAILLSLYIMIFGAQILIGTAQLNTKEILVRLMKIAGVWTFATQSTWGLSYIFQFFLGVATQGSMWVIGSINPAAMPAQNVDGNVMPMYSFLDSLIYDAVTGPFTAANDKVIGFFVVLMFFFPAIFAMACTWTLSTVVMLARTLVYFLLCLSAIAFLIALSPIFLSFMLFQSTMNFFEDWLKHLISYSLQIVIVFAIISLWVSAMLLFGGFFNELSNLIYPYQHVDVTNVFSPDDTYGICQYQTFYSPPGQPGQPCGTGPCLPSLACDPNINIDDNTVIPPSQLLFHQDFVYFMAYNLIALTIIAYTFGVLVKEAPKIATQLSGPAQVPPLGGGIGMKGFGQIGGAGTASGGLSAPSGTGNAVQSFLGNAGKMLTGRSKPPSS